MDDHQQLKIVVNKSLSSFIKGTDPKSGEINPNIKEEYEN